MIFQNPDDRDYFAAKGLLRRVRVQLIRGSGVDVVRFQPRAAAPRDPAAPLRVLFVGRLLREKGIQELIAAAALLRERQVPVEVLVAGSTQLGNPSSISEDERAAGSAVEWLGEVVPIDDLLASADLLVLPSWREGLPRTVLEAMAMGKPVVACDVPGCREAVVAGETGLLVPVRNPAALAAAIAALAADPARRVAMGIAGRARAVARQFRTELIEAQTLAAYREHLGRAL